LVKIFLDAGHGGKDSGAVGNGIQEKDINLKIVKKMDSLLKNYQDAEVILSRSEDVFITLDQRTRKANTSNADVLLSIHINAAADVAAKGFESYRYVTAKSATTSFQNVMHAEIVKAMGKIQDRGKKSANFHMLRESKMKACLTENLFISNAADAAKLKDDSFLDKIAQGHVNGLEKFLGLKRLEKPPQEKQPNGSQPSGSEKLYKVQAGAFEDRSNADALCADLTKEGFQCFVTFEDKLFKVQVGAFEDQENANALAGELRKEGFRPFVKYE
jgi:N-acetylmuramoyl-L-alanine amidase